MKISVALCTFNGARFLGEQLRSIAAQRRRPDELVVTDDGSTDATVEMIQRFAAGAAFDVRWEVNSRTLGPAGNFERAVSLCRGDVIALCDQDDVWMPHKLARIESAFAAKPNLGFVFSDALLIDARNRLQPGSLWSAIPMARRARREMADGAVFDVLLRGNVVAGASMAFRASHRDMLLPIPGTWLHDEWFALLLAAAAPCKAIAEPLFQYRRHAGQQIGASGGLWRQFRRGMSQKRDHFEAVAANHVAARNRLLQFHASLEGGREAGLLEEKIEHYRAKARMREPKARRLPLVVAELLRRHYARFSRGWKSGAQDLFL